MRNGTQIHCFYSAGFAPRTPPAALEILNSIAVFVEAEIRGEYDDMMSPRCQFRSYCLDFSGSSAFGEKRVIGLRNFENLHGFESCMKALAHGRCL